MFADLTIRNRRLLRLAGGVMLAGFLAFLAHTVVHYGDAGVAQFVETRVYDGLLLGAAASCLLRALLVERERAGWALMGAGLLAYSAGEIYYAAAISGTGEVPIPSPADAGYLAFYPLAYASLLLLTRERLGSFPAVRWLDGLIAGGAIAAVGAAVFFGPIVDSGSSGDTAAVATNLAYPVADLVLLSLVITVSALSAWRPGRSWLILGAGIVVLAGSDVIYLFESARGTYVEGGLLDAGWPFGVLLLAVAAWVDPSAPHAKETRGFRVALLNKPGPLDEREWEFMRTHTLIGERIIASAPSLVPVARLVRSSHERWDGSGYPDGLRGEETPLGSRIIAICDAYQAMVSERPYSVAMRPSRAIEEIAQGAGSQFDPEVVEAFRRVGFDRPVVADPPAIEAAADY